MIKKTGGKKKRDIDITIGKRIEDLRVSSGITKASLAELLEISHQQIDKYEKGKDRITASALLLIIEYLGISVQDFFLEIESKIENKAAKLRRISVPVMKSFNNIDDRELRSSVANIVHKLAGE